MKNLMIICLVLLTGALSAQDKPKKAAMKPNTEKKQAGSSNTKTAPETEFTPSPQPSAQPAQAPAPAPQERSIDEKGLSTKSATGKKQAVIQPDPNATKTEEKNMQARPR